MATLYDMTGQRIGRWTVLERDYTRPRGSHTYWLCRCDCGTIRSVEGKTLRRGYSRSCRCIVSERTSERNYTHGGTHTAEYLIWDNMKRRCNDPSNPNYKRYGARGIRVCTRWANDFAAFISDMGQRPSKRHSIERLDNSGDYTPENCAWATKAEQIRNTRYSRKLTFNGKTQCVIDWARELGIKPTTLSQRLNAYGWSAEKALTTPVAHRRAHR